MRRLGLAQPPPFHRLGCLMSRARGAEPEAGAAAYRRDRVRSSRKGPPGFPTLASSTDFFAHDSFETEPAPRNRHTAINEEDTVKTGALRSRIPYATWAQQTHGQPAPDAVTECQNIWQKGCPIAGPRACFPAFQNLALFDTGGCLDR